MAKRLEEQGIDSKGLELVCIKGGSVRFKCNKRTIVLSQDDMLFGRSPVFGMGFETPAFISFLAGYRGRRENP